MSRAWFESPERVRINTGRDDVLSFGVAEAGGLITPILLAASTRVLTYLGEELCRGLAREAATLVCQQLRQLILREGTSIGLTSSQIDKARQVTLEVARRYRVSTTKAEQIAEAVAGRLRSHP
jgi:hypothetical protein